MYDVVRAFETNPQYNFYSNNVAQPPPGADVDAAVNGAAVTVLTNLFPLEASKYALAARFHADLLRHRGVRINSYRSGFNFGVNVAQNNLAGRTNDGSTVNPTVTLSGAPGDFDCNFVNNVASCPSATGWGDVTPFVIPSANVQSFVPTEGPSFPDFDQYETDYNEVLGRGTFFFDSLYGNVPKRTGTETFLAAFYAAEGAGTTGTGARFLQIAQDICCNERLPRFPTARLLALSSLAIADAAIVAYRTKYTYNAWRPQSGITEAGSTSYPTDLTTPFPNWEPFGTTPANPDYISVSAAYGGALEAVLRNIYSEDEHDFYVHSDQIPKVRALYSYFSDMSSDNAASGVFLGENFRTSSNDGLSTGVAIGEYVVANALTPITAPA